MAQVDEFLKIKTTNGNITSPAVTVTSTGTKRKDQIQIIDTSPVKKQKINWVLGPVVQQPKIQTQTISTGNTIVANSGTKTQTVSLQDLKFLSANNKCLVPITMKDERNNDQQVVAHLDTKNLVLPTAYLQMKLQPQITTVDGQQVVQLTSAGNLPTSISLTSAGQQPQIVQSQIQIPQQQLHTSQATIGGETRILTTSSGQNLTITQPMQQHLSTVETSAGKVQLTTLQNVPTPNITHPLPPGSAITLRSIKLENHNDTSPPTKIITRPQTFKLATLPTVKNSTSIANTSFATTGGKATVVTATKKAPVNRTTNATTKTILVSTTTQSPADNRSNGNTNSSTTADQSKTDVPTCEICEKVFKRKEHLAQHMKLHLGLRPFKCEEPNCNKAFSRKEHLMRHCVSHTGKKQFDCEFCHKLFSRKDNLNKHKRSAHNFETVKTKATK